MIEKICMPALIYLIFSMTHVIIDTYKGLYNTAIIEFWISAVFTVLLSLLCTHDMSIIAWLIISIPFILMTIIATLLLFAFKLNPATGQSLKSETSETSETSELYPHPVTYNPVPTIASTTDSPAPSRRAYPIDVFYSSSFLSSK